MEDSSSDPQRQKHQEPKHPKEKDRPREVLFHKCHINTTSDAASTPVSSPSTPLSILLDLLSSAGGIQSCHLKAAQRADREEGLWFIEDGRTDV